MAEPTIDERLDSFANNANENTKKIATSINNIRNIANTNTATLHNLVSRIEAIEASLSNVNISNSVIENCVILDESEIKNYRLKNCILSKGTTLINTSPNRKIIENKII